MEKDDGAVDEMKSEATQEKDGGGGGESGMSRDPYFNSLQGESGRQKNLSACTYLLCIPPSIRLVSRS
ncbi:hypothetical protein EYF80_027859 [Liparis tanakae]|uniref:Uncharacterized protein n=1 Tax=Liparis tanakae TaxID=230148 RepID=A0A4Z2HAX1_9TELE|nr:hypothetical protein EYF80_027859 [Liparis tanakae]